MGIIEKAWFVRFRTAVTVVSTWFERVGLLAMVTLGLTALTDVIGSKVFHLPLPGSTEIGSVVQVMAIAGGLAFSKLDGRHIRVDFLIGWLPKRGRAVLDVFSSSLGLALFALAGWMTFKHGLSLLSSGTSTFLLGIPLAPFVFWISLCIIPMWFAIMLDLLTSIDGLHR
jgi:TRAP-type C4-dicarboxylate transport system permease small subunit